MLRFSACAVLFENATWFRGAVIRFGACPVGRHIALRSDVYPEGAVAIPTDTEDKHLSQVVHKP
jgi:hypothetical protein